jgi:hypothetical protein
MFAALVLLLFCAFVFIPLVAENTGAACEAAASELARTQTVNLRIGRFNLTAQFGSGLARSIGGPAVKQIVRRRYPTMPVVMSCSAAWWGLLIAPQETMRAL